jgi:hypothetical protein
MRPPSILFILPPSFPFYRFMMFDGSQDSPFNDQAGKGCSRIFAGKRTLWKYTQFDFLSSRFSLSLPFASR